MPGHPRIEDMTTLRLVSRQARRAVKFGGRDGVLRRKRGRPRNDTGLMDVLANNALVVGEMQGVDWDVVLKVEREAEYARREERRVQADAEAVERRKVEEAAVAAEGGVGRARVLRSETPVRRSEEPYVPRIVIQDNQEMMEVEMEVEEEIPPDELDALAAPRIVGGREFRSRRPPKKFRKVFKKVLVPVKKGKEPDSPAEIATPTIGGRPSRGKSVTQLPKQTEIIQKVLTTLPSQILERSKNPDDDVIYCICEYPESDFFNTVACDFCNIWLHSDCVGYTDPDTVDKSKHHKIKGLMKDGKWKCPRCRKEVLLVPA
ncbi:hypothetical protein BC830DRAFT_210761 [Chytriomyces sp. MP71]|nr:hypothetical protein BC830DRAFT_210761 [Chytriomyces sp. MP71]